MKSMTRSPSDTEEKEEDDVGLRCYSVATAAPAGQGTSSFVADASARYNDEAFLLLNDQLYE